MSELKKTSEDWVCTVQKGDLAESVFIAMGTQIMAYFKQHKKFEYAVWQLECAPTTGRLHYQVYLNFNQPVVGHWVRKTFHGVCAKNVHVQATDFPLKSLEYCMKWESRQLGPYSTQDYDFEKTVKTRELEDCFENMNKIMDMD